MRYFVWVTANGRKQCDAMFMYERDANEYRDKLRREHPDYHVELQRVLA